MKRQNILLIFFMLSISYVAGYYSNSPAKSGGDVTQKDTTTVEKVVIQETGKTTTITRKVKDRSLEVSKVPRKWRTSVLIEPLRRDSLQLVVGYRLMENVWLEGNLSNINGGTIMTGIGVEF